MIARDAALAGDGAIADAFYTVLSAGIVVLAGLAVSAIVLGAANQQARSLADGLDGPGGPGLKKGLYAFYYVIDTPADYGAADPNRIRPGDLVAARAEPSIQLDGSSLPPGAPATGGLAIWTGHILTGAAGEYVFQLWSAGGAWLWVDGELIVDNHGAHPLKDVCSPPVYLSAGRHAVKVRYFYLDAGQASCRVLVNAGGTWASPAFFR